MLLDPSYDIHAAVFATLSAQPALTGRVYHRVPAAAQLPYLEIGHDQIFGAGQLGGEMFEIDVEVNAFAANVMDVKQTVSVVYGALKAFIPVANFKVIEVHYDGAQYRTEVYGSDQVEHALISFRYLVEAQAA
jgi:hypothetical protein